MTISVAAPALMTKATAAGTPHATEGIINRSLLQGKRIEWTDADASDRVDRLL